MLGPAAKVVDCARDLAGPGINCSDALATSIRGENALSFRVIDNPVGVVSHPCLVEHSERLEVEHRDRTGVSGADEPVSKFPRDGHAVHALQIRDLADDGARIQIEYNYFDTVRNVQAAAFAVGGDVIPSSIAGYRNPRDHMRAARRRGRSSVALRWPGYLRIARGFCFALL